MIRGRKLQARTTEELLMENKLKELNTFGKPKVRNFQTFIGLDILQDSS